MIEALLVTLFPVAFLILLFGGGMLFRRKEVDQDGEPPINRALFYTSKYSIVVVWSAAVLASWDIDLAVLEVPPVVAGCALALWIAGFVMLFLGRFGLGNSFRLGTPKESTSLQTAGLYGVSRNPMYLGVYATVLASALYTMNPLAWALGALACCVHHRIVLAEEAHMRTAFGMVYDEYCRRVGRYIGPVPRRRAAS